VQWSGLIGAFLVTAIIIGVAATWKPPEETKIGDIVFVREKRGRKYVMVPKYKDSRPANQSSEIGEDDGEDSGATGAATTPAGPTKPQWTLNLQAAQIPSEAASGDFGGRPFTAERAYLQRSPTGYLLTVRQGPGPRAEREIMVMLPLASGQTLDGQSFDITADTSTGPRLIKRWLENNRQQTRIFTNGYAMKLQFEQTANNQIPAKLFVALPDEEKTYIAGSLTASILIMPPAQTSQTQQRRQ
jgi:hypothetical protein